ncbi:MAG: uracil-DNA glycosylase, partial [Thiomicrorhabdus sp.]|nr:uracil-DNA glycosylase [Thiomicrorhabdus sp.]
MLFDSLHPEWQAALGKALTQPSLQAPSHFLNTEAFAGKTILPPHPLWFNALNTTPLSQVKVVILGQ